MFNISLEPIATAKVQGSKRNRPRDRAAMHRKYRQRVWMETIPKVPALKYLVVRQSNFCKMHPIHAIRMLETTALHVLLFMTCCIVMLIVSTR
jgi:hypothetical protein